MGTDVIVRVPDWKGANVGTPAGNIQFDEDGCAEVAPDALEFLRTRPGFEIVGEAPPKAAAEAEPVLAEPAEPQAEPEAEVADEPAEPEPAAEAEPETPKPHRRGKSKSK